MIVGTAGHIDHGKTSLVRALTGVDTDRLKEEKARGITIELGFAYVPLADGGTLGFVDVPGHERLVHTMLAGATGIDFALLVVAADDGVMPQTREHLAIIDLLGISGGAVAVTKCDAVSASRIAEVTAEVRVTVAATALAAAEIVPVSALSGAGLDRLRAVLECEARQVHTRTADGRFRLAVDRVFSLAGAGTVVTGTALSGSVAVGDRVVISPSGIEARVRSIHAQNIASQTGRAGERCALALVGPKVDTQSVQRGDVVLDPSLHAPVKRIDAQVRLLGAERKRLSGWVPVKLHHGSAAFNARLLPLSDVGLAPGASGFVQLVLDRPAALAVGDRIVLRDTSATRTMGGGTILDLHPPERQRTAPQRLFELAILRDWPADDALAQLLASERGFVDLDAFYKDRAFSTEAARQAAERLSLVTLKAGASTFGLLPEVWQRYMRDAVALLTAFHTEKPDLPGLGQERLRLGLSPRLPAPAFTAALHDMARAAAIVTDRAWVRLPGHEVRFSPEEERMFARITPLIGGAERFRPPRVRDIAKAQKLDEAFVRRLFKLAARRGDVDELAHDHYFLAATVVEMADIARALAAAAPDGEFTVIEFRDRLDNGRKVAIQVLEFFDRQGLTMRRGDIRRINPHKADLFSALPSAVAATGADGGESLPVGRPDFKSGEGRETALGGFDSCLLRQSTKGGGR